MLWIPFSFNVNIMAAYYSGCGWILNLHIIMRIIMKIIIIIIIIIVIVVVFECVD